MLIKYICQFLVLLTLLLMEFSAAAADNEAPICRRLDEKATGDMAKYSVYGEANGPVFFSSIRCAITYRNKEFCAMEMVSFDSTAKVYDYYSGAEIEIANAFFWLDEENDNRPIAAFTSEAGAEKYGTEAGTGVILDYPALIDRKFN